MGFEKPNARARPWKKAARYQARAKQLDARCLWCDRFSQSARTGNERSWPKLYAKIGNLTITSEVLAALLNGQGADGSPISD